MKQCSFVISLLLAVVSATFGDSLDVKEIGCYQTTNVTADICVSGDYAYISYFDKALRVIDVSDMTSPVEVGSCDASLYYYPNGIFTTGSYVYLAYGFGGDSTGISIIDVSTKSNPNEISFTATENRAHDVCASGSYAYVPQCLGVQIYDLGTPSFPVAKGFCDISLANHPQAVFVSGNYAYVTGTEKLELIDISDPNKPFISGYCTFDSSYTWDVYVSGSYAYVAADISGLRIVDVSDPENPVQVGVFDTPGIAKAVSISGNFAYVADDYTGLRIIDISTPSDPVEVGFYETPNIAEDVYASHPYALVTCHSAGLRIYEYGHVTDTKETYPSPIPTLELRALVNRLEYTVQNHATLAVYSANGNLILRKDVSENGILKINTLPTGVYFARLSSENAVNETKMIVLH